MIRRFVIAGFVALLLVSGVYAEEPVIAPSNEEVGVALTVITDCISASLVTSCTDSNITLPCSNVQMDNSRNLPRRISYFLADPSEYVRALEPRNESANGFFASLLSLLNNASDNPVVSAVYVAMATRGYRTGSYLLSGSISFTYPEMADLATILSIWSSRTYTDQSISMNVDMMVYGNNLVRPMSVSGLFEMGVDASGDVVIKSVGIYTINGIAYQGGEFRL